MLEDADASRRRFVHVVGAAGLITASELLLPAVAQESGNKKDEEEVTPPEDLMREHGVLDRVLLIYEAIMRKFSANEDFDPGVLTESAQIVRDFIENYSVRTASARWLSAWRTLNGPSACMISASLRRADPHNVHSPILFSRA